MLQWALHGTLTGATAGLLVWSAHFVLVYGLLSIGCAAGWQGTHILGVGILVAMLVAITLLSLFVIALLIWHGVQRWRRLSPAADRERFMALLGTLVAVLAFVGTLWDGLPVLLFPPCV